MSIILQAEDLRKDYPTGGEPVAALRGVDLTIEEGRFYAIVGRSGSGKSTLLHLLGGFDRPTSGRVLLEGEDISQLSPAAQATLRRRKLGFVFQAYQLLPELSAEENVRLPLWLDHQEGDDAWIDALFERLGLAEKRLRFPSQLSGGEQQRVAIARALAAKPRLLLADEPTGNLDRGSGEAVMALLKELNGHFHQTILLVTHDGAAVSYADTVLRMEDGHITEEVGT